MEGAGDIGTDAPGEVPEGSGQETLALYVFSLSSLSSGSKFPPLQRIKCHLAWCEATVQLWTMKELGN